MADIEAVVTPSADPAKPETAPASGPADTSAAGPTDTGPGGPEATGPARPSTGPGHMGAASHRVRRPRWRRRLLEDGSIVALALIVAILVRAFVAQAYWIPSASMEPQLMINDRVVVSRLAYDLHSPHRGDIIVFKSPPGVEPPTANPSGGFAGAMHDVGVALGFAQDQTVLIKRVIGLPGETIEGRRGHVFVDGHRLVEPYLPAGTFTSAFGPVTIPPHYVWVMGDNRTDSTDSRVFGPVPESSIVGRAVWRVWPIWQACFL